MSHEPKKPLQRVRETIAQIEACKERLSSSKPGPEVEELTKIEHDLKQHLDGREILEKDVGIMLIMVWSVMSLAFKKDYDYRNSLACLKKSKRLEAALRVTPLDMAVTLINISTCHYFLKEADLSLGHSTAARDLLVQEMKLMQKTKSHIASGYKKKLLLNLVVALFNRGVQYLLKNDHDNFRVNINQSLELATQKFGKDEVITHMVQNMIKKDKSEMMPFFVNKLVDFKTLLTHAEERDTPVFIRDVILSEPEEEVKAAQNRTILREGSGKRIKGLETRFVSSGSNKLPQISHKGKDLRESSAERSISAGPVRLPSEKPTKSQTHRSEVAYRNDKKRTETSIERSLIGDKYRLAQSETRNYTINRVSVALKYMK